MKTEFILRWHTRYGVEEVDAYPTYQEAEKSVPEAREIFGIGNFSIIERTIKTADI